ncbi:hypothetical protein E6R61_12685 [Streptomyces sp. LRa12]|nr:hypothetical protein E6R61_12685 [Streptomyces sp. LRa12]
MRRRRADRLGPVRCGAPARLTHGVGPGGPPGSAPKGRGERRDRPRRSRSRRTAPAPRHTPRSV